jgi:hypothetical protein
MKSTVRPTADQKDSRVHFNVEEAQADFYKKWARPDAASVEQRIFDSIGSMFVFAAALAFSRGIRRPIKGNRRDVFRWTNLDEINQTLLRAIAMADPGGGVDVLLDRGSIADIVEEYASAGVDMLKAEIGEDASRDRAVEALARLGLEATSSGLSDPMPAPGTGDSV